MCLRRKVDPVLAASMEYEESGRHRELKGAWSGNSPALAQMALSPVT